MPYVAPRIARAVPDARLVAVLREPVARAYSHWWMMRCAGVEPLSFAAAIRASLRDAERLQEPDLEERWRAHRAATARGAPVSLRGYVSCGQYAEQVERYLRIFPRGQLAAVRHDDLRADPAGTARRLWRFLGVDEHAPRHVPQHNTAMRPVLAGVQRGLAATGLARVMPYVPAGARRTMRAWLQRAGPDPPPMEQATRALLREHYAAHNERLARLLGWNLAAWEVPA
ncbi:MAG: sulfotransferase domain-containing protein [Halobacteriales archaeon]|nr:sulfotransferase domain-containing protein [Halobacteriales archaeon]